MTRPRHRWQAFELEFLRQHYATMLTTSAIAREVGDTNDWLDWYCWENDMGAKGQEVTSTSGKTIKVTTVAHLARVICY